MYTKKRIKSLLGLLALGRPKYDSVQLYDYSKPKYESLEKKSAARPRPHLNQSARIRVCPRSNHSQSLMNGNFAAF